MSKPRILYIDTERVWRGGQEQLLSLILGIQSFGFDVTVATPQNSPLAQRLQTDSIQLVHFSQRNELSPIAFSRLLRIMWRGKFDVVHFNTPVPIMAGSLAASISGCRVKISSRRVNFPLKSALSRFKYTWFLDSIATVSESIKATLIEFKLPPNMIEVVYEGVDLRWIDSLPRKNRFGGAGPVVGTVAYLSEEKGHHTLIEAAARLVTEFPTARFVLVGDGELRSQLEIKRDLLQLKDNVVFMGFRTDSEAIMKEFDVFCLPSLSEGLSSAILAAMAASLPVVATDVGGIPELVQDGETGFLCPSADVEELVSALRKTLIDPQLRQSLGQAGRRRIEDHFTVQDKLQQTADLYSRLLAAS